MEIFNVSYNQLKTIQSNRGLSYNYVTGSNFFQVFLVDVVKDAVFSCNLPDDASDNDNDFKTNIQPTAVNYGSIDDGVADLVSSFIPSTVVLSADSVASTQAEAAVSFVATTISSTGSSQGKSATSYSVPSGKILVLQSGLISASAGNLIANVNMDYKIRTGNPVSVTSPIAFDSQMQISANNSEVTPISIGVAIPSGQQVMFTQAGGTGVTGAFTIVGILV